MSFFDRLFGKDKQEKPRTGGSSGGGGGGAAGGPGITLDKLDAAFELLEKREAVLEHKAGQELTKAKAFYAKKNTTAAMQCMKRKKMYEDQIMSYCSQKANLEALRFTLQNQNMNQEVLDAQVGAKKELKKANKKMDADTVDEEMDDLMEEMGKANQVSEALQRPLGDNLVDEDELMMELKMEMEGGAEEAAELAAMMGIPNVPDTELPQRTQAQYEEEELRELEAALAMEHAER